ncbi:MAG: hypothetical protein AB1651_08215 [Pseudomonadota bacterium]
MASPAELFAKARRCPFGGRLFSHANAIWLSDGARTIVLCAEPVVVRELR